MEPQCTPYVTARSAQPSPKCPASTALTAAERARRLGQEIVHRAGNGAPPPVHHCVYDGFAERNCFFSLFCGADEQKTRIQIQAECQKIRIQTNIVGIFLTMRAETHTQRHTRIHLQPLRCAQGLRLGYFFLFPGKPHPKRCRQSPRRNTTPQIPMQVPLHGPRKLGKAVATRPQTRVTPPPPQEAPRRKTWGTASRHPTTTAAGLK